MNLRILKKLSKRAAPYLARIGDTREQFLAEKGENYHGLIIRDLAKLDRTPSCHTDIICKQTHAGTLSPKCRAGSEYPYVKLGYPCHPLKGTPMVGGMSGYYEPEWDEETAWTALRNWVVYQFFKYNSATDDAYFTWTPSGPGDVFRMADELLAGGRNG
ncbi:hypothetical protein RSK20926_11624 [Roseobacter sp. SK209-2-6]|uniref:hypothetical protein n=1 Tax=Roseobacter sp. SK209-2-6 TaxID=388739 RepID=UPI0000F3C7F4|nr:hypothetical protein [Roseobacter sp. SK209-2-6]EBA18366.1 hypothetical protein RSK20926_11624 [Roseobacter sp. SK209-2-6]